MTIDRRRVLSFFAAEAERPAGLAEVARALRLTRKDQAGLLRVCRDLVRSGELIELKDGRFGVPEQMHLVVGELSCSPKGYGFVVPEKGGKDVFVRLPNMMGALHGDRVAARIEHTKADGRREGSVVRVVHRRNLRLLGCLKLKPYPRVVPLEPKLLVEVVVAPEARMGAGDGEVVEVEVERFPGASREAAGSVIARLGSFRDPRVDLELVLRRHELPRRFPPDLLGAARAVATLPAGELERRTDFRGQAVVTIDGEHSRDFDDAISIERPAGGGYRLGVHIADVSHYVREESALDEEAYARATSVYFPDHVIPMLPEDLSNGICSLNPQADRLTLSLVMEVDRTGEVVDYRYHPGVIRSAARLTYGEVHRILVEREVEARERRAALLPLLETMEDLYRALALKRRQRGSLDFDLPESEIVLDLAGAMTGIKRGQRLLSHGIIEEFMILANETTALHLMRSVPASVYRVHEPPDPTDIEALNRTLAGFGERVDGERALGFRQLLEKVKGRPEERLVNTATLRTMKLARYQTEDIGHFGLASEHYTHFTSPIRRYPDLIVHRLIKATLAAAPAKQPPSPGQLEEAAADCSRLERRAEEAEREYIERKKARFMEGKVGESFDGVITAVEAFGLFVELDEFFIEGLVHLTSLADDYYRYDEDRHQLLGEHTGRRLLLGDRVTVRVEKVDLLRRQIDFVLEGAEAPQRPRRSRPPGRPGRRPASPRGRRRR